MSKSDNGQWPQVATSLKRPDLEAGHKLRPTRACADGDCAGGPGVVAAAGRRRVESESGHRDAVSRPASRRRGGADRREWLRLATRRPGERASGKKTEGDFHLNAVRGAGSGWRRGPLRQRHGQGPRATVSGVEGGRRWRDALGWRGGAGRVGGDAVRTVVGAVRGRACSGTSWWREERR